MAKVVGDWTAGMEGWQASDPWEQCWKDHLYQVVETNSNLPTWGSCGKITLQPVPEVAGATGSYLYLKDCGEFDTEKYQYDLNYMNYVFGLPLGVTGKAANNFIDDILLNVVGVAPQKGGANSLSATGNTNGLHVYNDYDWALVSKEITASDGNMLKFGWSFQGGDAKHGDDAAFWILKDVATGEIVASDLLAQGPDAVNGTAEVLLPSAGGCGTYILTIGQMNVGTYNGDQHKGNPHMLIGSVVQEQNDNVVGPVFSPNLQPLPLTEVIGDWDNGLSGWMVSDPWEQCWQDYLYQYVNTNVNLQGWGACGKITLPPVPHVDGATGKYLYLKDCGEFDTEKYDYDLNYLNYAFG
ncbi:MAG: hypothetical protein LBE22_11895, partial [Azoarcus sp.]|nr:hypothetical protein [Azoarcus sp.]